jgi:prepilin-type N-terminal cleavage/methylation domain-containing protein/prepilin-type processing-associated H-X9-DG protein
MKTRKGFTLIELLVVIAIIAILAAILFPVFVKAKEKARTMKCLAHGREMGQAMQMYLADNLDRFPSANKPTTDARNAYLESITWRYDWAPGTKWNGGVWNAGFCTMQYFTLKPYVKNQDIFICPDPNTMYAKRYAFGFRCSWFFNGSGLSTTGDAGLTGRTLGEAQAIDAAGGYTDPDGNWVGLKAGKNWLPPSKKIEFLCYTLGRWAQGGHVGDGSYPWVFPSYAHADGSTYVYADGHAEWKRTGMGCAPIGYTQLDIDQHQ